MLDEALLDDPDRLADADPEAVLRATASAGATVRRALTRTREAGLDRVERVDRPRAVVVLAGGSTGTAAAALAALAEPGPAPVIVLTDPATLPLWVNPADVVVSVTTTGTEEGPLRALDNALRRGASVTNIAPAGSPAEELCGRARAVSLPVEPVGPGDLAGWDTLVPLLLAAGALGVVPVDAADLDVAADTLDETAARRGPAVDTVANQAKTLAVELDGAVPVCWGSSPIAGAAARRLAAALAVRAGKPAVSGTLPGVLGEQGGLLRGRPTGAADFFRDRVDEPEPEPGIRLVLAHDTDEPDTAGLVDQLRESARRTGIPVTDLTAEGDRPVCRYASLAATGEFAAVYLGLGGRVESQADRLGEWPT